MPNTSLHRPRRLHELVLERRQEREHDREHELVPEQRARDEEQRRDHHERHRELLLGRIETRRDERPRLPEDHRQRDHEAAEQGALQVGEEDLARRDRLELPLPPPSAATAGASSAREDLLLPGPRDDRRRRSTRAIDLISRLRSSARCSVSGSAALVHRAGSGVGRARDRGSRGRRRSVAAAGDRLGAAAARSRACGLRAGAGFGSSTASLKVWRRSVEARRNSPIARPSERASSGSRVGPKTISATTRITSSSVMPMPNIGS